jgi:4-alpha-glucanotransferase
LASRERTSGVLLHPASLPGAYGIGDIGPPAHAWIWLLAQSRQTWWQVLPLGPTGYGDSPYQSPSSFAGNPNLLSPELLVEDGLLEAADLLALHLPPGPIDYASVICNKRRMLHLASSRFGRCAGSLRDDYLRFTQAEADWLEDFVLYMAIKNEQGERAWPDWPIELARREASALAEARRRLRDEIDVQRLGQFLFFRQWQRVREVAKAHNVRLIGDLPIFVAYDSADVWAQPELFQLDAQRRPLIVAGVPPDYFSATGQLWGNPIYDWDRMLDDGFSWWVNRLRAALRLVDLVRLDHFRGLAAYWAIPAGDHTAEHGRWLPGPGADLLNALRSSIGTLPIIAEDLGFITPDVDALRSQFALPGMRILQFAFGGATEERFLPHRFEPNVIVYTGTHDNDTTQGWYAKLTAEERRHFSRYAPGAELAPAEALIRLAWASVADCALVPYQDVLALGDEARLNQPGTTAGNWRWRVGDLPAGRLELLFELSEVYQRNSTN